MFSARNQIPNTSAVKNAITDIGDALGIGTQRRSQEFNSAEAQKTRDWQEQMSNTAYQRAVSDMKAAGLNPALMYGNGGAESTPSGATASSGGGGIGSAANMLSSAANLISANERNKNLQAQKSVYNTAAKIAAKVLKTMG